MQRILVVDDERLVADTLGLIFRKHGFETKVVYSAEEALHCAPGFLPQLILCDIMMPGCDGVELMQAVSKTLPDCRFLVLTGRSSGLKRVQGYTSTLSQATGIFTKPCQPAMLLREAGMMLGTA